MPLFSPDEQDLEQTRRAMADDRFKITALLALIVLGVGALLAVVL